MRTAAILLPMLLVAVAVSPEVAAAQTRSRSAKAEWKTGKAFQATLDAKISATWQASEIGEASQIRSILNDVGERFQIAILLDRRVDPQQHLTLEVADEKLADVLKLMAEILSTDETPLGVSVLTNIVYIGPKPAAERLRTLIELRTRELDRQRTPRGRRNTPSRSLTGRYSFAWDDLQSPRELLDDWTKRYRLSIDNPDAVEHDLWRAGDLPQATLAEALSVVLNQFDLTFAWREEGTRLSIELMPVPDDVFVESTVSLKSLKLDRGSVADIERLLEEAGLAAPPKVAKIDGDEVTIAGSVEAVEELMAALSTGQGKKKRLAPQGSLSRKVFTLTVRDAPLGAILEKLTADGAPIEYDAEAFAAAGIDLTKKVTVSVEQASIEELLEAIFESQPVEVNVKKDGVVLRVREE